MKIVYEWINPTSHEGRLYLYASNVGLKRNGIPFITDSAGYSRIEMAYKYNVRHLKEVK